MHSFFAAPSSMSFAQFFSKNSRMLLLLLPPMALAFQAEYVPAGSVCKKYPQEVGGRGGVRRISSAVSRYDRERQKPTREEGNNNDTTRFDTLRLCRACGSKERKGMVLKSNTARGGSTTPR